MKIIFTPDASAAYTKALPVQYIYVLYDPADRADPKEPRYVGQTSDPHDRYSLGDCSNSQLKDWVEVLEAGGSGPTMVVVQAVEKSKADYAEMSLIQKCLDRHFDLFNAMVPVDPKDFSKGMENRFDWNIKRAKHRARCNTPEHKAKLESQLKNMKQMMAGK